MDTRMPYGEKEETRKDTRMPYGRNKEINMNKIFEEFSKIGIIPVIAIEDASDAEPLARALMDGGLFCAEVTFRTEAAEAVIRKMTENYPDMLVGAGTVLTTEQVDAAVNAGAEFIVSPGFNAKVVKYCLDKEIPVMPGCSTPSDIEAAIELGLEAVKIFPAEASGGIQAIRAMSAPYHKMKFMPTGGIHSGNLKSYLDFKKILACGGSFMVRDDLMRKKDWEGIAALTREAVSSMLGFTIHHIGINCENETKAAAFGERFADLFGAKLNTGEKSVFAGPYVELMKRPGRGAHGHIAVGVNYVERAVYQLEKRGFRFEESGRVYDKDGKLGMIYFADEIAGFAVHLVKNDADSNMAGSQKERSGGIVK